MICDVVIAEPGMRLVASFDMLGDVSLAVV